MLYEGHFLPSELKVTQRSQRGFGATQSSQRFIDHFPSVRLCDFSVEFCVPSWFQLVRVRECSVLSPILPLIADSGTSTPPRGCVSKMGRTSRLKSGASGLRPVDGLRRPFSPYATGRRRSTTGAIESSFLISSPARLEAGEEAKEGACAQKARVYSASAWRRIDDDFLPPN